MARLPRHQRLLRKAEAALVAGIEVYSKPNFPYREETFAILSLNAWELLLKAKLLQDVGNDLRRLHVYEQRKLTSGRTSSKLYLRRNRSGNPHTIGVARVIATLENDVHFAVPPSVKSNLDALTEIRDNAVHYMNASPALAKQVLEIGTACVKNFVSACRDWFRRDLSHYNLYLMPLGFVGGSAAVALPTSPPEKNLVTFLSDLVRAEQGETTADYNVALEVNLSFTRTTGHEPWAVQVTRDSTATPVTLREEDILKQYPWDYEELTRRLAERYADFKTNDKYHSIRKQLMADARLCHRRLLDPRKPSSTMKVYYNPNTLKEFDKHYTRKNKT